MGPIKVRARMGKASTGPVPVVVMGLGFIGQEIARAAHASPELKLVGAVDSSPLLAGKKLGDLLGNPQIPLKVAPRLADAVGKVKNAVLLHATASRLPQVMEQLLEAAEHGMSVVSTCEELAFPFLKYPDLAAKLERAAQKAGVTMLGTGVNPGFVMDRLVAAAGQVCGVVRRATATRVVDARTRREALQRKIGAGLTEAEFDALAEKDQIGHVGLLESAALCSVGLGLDCDDFEEELVPVIAEEDILGGAFPVKAGRVAGISQTAVGLEDGQERVRLELTIAVGADEPGDRIHLDADPEVEILVKGGVAGDRATANVVVNAAPRVTAADAGLLTVLELPSGR
jgi:4-hydroxy-tetrahydrodipicolinate reductase